MTERKTHSGQADDFKKLRRTLVFTTITLLLAFFAFILYYVPFEVLNTGWVAAILVAVMVLMLADTHILYRLITAVTQTANRDGAEGPSLHLDIHENESAQSALCESERRYRSLFDDLPISIWEEDLSGIKRRIDELRDSGVTDLENYLDEHPGEVTHFASLLRVINVNKATLALYGADNAEKFISDTLAFFPKDVLASFRDEILAIAENKIAFVCDTIAKTASGGEKHVHLSWSVLPGYEETYARVLLYVIDITERKQAEETLRESEAYARTILESINTGFVIIDADSHTIVDANPAAIKIFGSTKEHLVGSLCHKFICPAELGKCPISDLGQRIDNSERILLNARGEQVPIIKSVFPVTIGGHRYLLENFIDITEHKRAEDALKKSEANYRTIFNSVNDAIFLHDPKSGKILDVNRKMCEMYSCTHDEALTGDIRSLSSDVEDSFSKEQAQERVRRAMEVEPQLFEWRAKDKFGKIFWIEVNLTACVINGEERVLAVVRDITERKRAEEKEMEMERRLLHAQKLESLGVLAGGIAHDFNNLLMAILGNLDLALYDLSPVSSARTSVEDAIHATRRAEALTRQMLAYSGRGRFIVNDMDLSELVEENAHMLRASISKNVKLNLSLDKGSPPIAADAGQIQQVVMNLITNASESLGDKAGIVALSTGAMDCDEECLKRSRLMEKPAPGRFVFLEVTDTGCGMDEETQGLIFDPFFTTKFTGRGLGMSAVLGIVRGHQGAIMVESEVGRGSTIRVLFPVSKTASVERGPKEKAAKGRIRNAGEPPLSGTVLVVDDEECVRRPCVTMVKHAGYLTLSAANGNEAVALFRDHADEIVCVILDLTMPGMDGVATFEALRAIKPNVRVILSSGYDEQEVTQRFSEQRPTGFIKKPYEMKTLLAELERVVKRDGLKA